MGKPVRPRAGPVGSQVGDVSVLGERLASAPQLAALLEARVEVVQQRAADRAHLLGPERRLDGAADVTEVGFLRGNLPPGDGDVCVEQFGDGDARVGVLS